MNTSLLRLAAAVFALVFIAAACASTSGAQWTFAPVAVSDTSESVDSAESVDAVGAVDGSVTEPEEAAEASESEPEEAAEASEAEAEEAATEETESEPEEAAATGGEARFIDLQADGALRFTDAEGQQIQDIAVTPGETVVFRVDNTAGFAHNFYIGEDAELMVPSGSTDTGIPDWSTGVQELEWVVPDDISNLKFGCTVPGHYTLMQGTFSVSE